MELDLTPAIDFYKKQMSPGLSKNDDYFEAVDKELKQYFDNKNSVMNRYIKKNFDGTGKAIHVYKMLSIFAFSQRIGLVKVNWKKLSEKKPADLETYLKTNYKLMKSKHPEVIKKWDAAYTKSKSKGSSQEM